jgi:hypothetical protein
MEALAEGLWRWTQPHPGWTPEKDTPSGWKEDVATVAFASPDGALVLVDPLVRDEDLWTWLAEARRPIVVLSGNRFHHRSTDEVVARLGAKVVTSGQPLPAGVEAFAIEGLDGGETAYHLAAPKAVIFADAVIGKGGGEVRVAPASWAVDPVVYAQDFRRAVARATERPIELVLPSHGAPVLGGGGAALRRALEGPAWGE